MDGVKQVEDRQGARGVAGDEDAVLEQLMADYREFAQGMLRSARQGELDVTVFEKRAIEAFAAIGGRLAAQCLQTDPRDAQRRCPKCGKAAQGKRRRTHRKLLFGEVSFHRTHCYCAHCGASFSPSGHGLALRQGLL